MLRAQADGRCVGRASLSSDHAAEQSPGSERRRREPPAIVIAIARPGATIAPVATPITIAAARDHARRALNAAAGACARADSGSNSGTGAGTSSRACALLPLNLDHVGLFCVRLPDRQRPGSKWSRVSGKRKSESGAERASGYHTKFLHQELPVKSITSRVNAGQRPPFQSQAPPWPLSSRRVSPSGRFWKIRAPSPKSAGNRDDPPGGTSFPSRARR